MGNTPKPRMAKVVVYDGEDLARLAELDVAVERAQRVDRVKRLPLDNAVEEAERRLRAAEKVAEGGVRLLHESDPLASLREQLKAAREERDALPGTADAVKIERDEFADEAETRGTLAVLIARPRLRWRALMKEHGPREGNDDDKVFGVNMETMPDTLLPESIDVAMSTIDGDVREFLETLSDYDYYDRFFVIAFALNRGSAVADPTQRLLSISSPISAATSS